MIVYNSDAKDKFQLPHFDCGLSPKNPIPEAENLENFSDLYQDALQVHNITFHLVQSEFFENVSLSAIFWNYERYHHQNS